MYSAEIFSEGLRLFFLCPFHSGLWEEEEEEDVGEREEPRDDLPFRVALVTVTPDTFAPVRIMTS